MIALLVVQLALSQGDTVRVEPLAAAPVFDGRVDTAEYGTPSIVISKPGGLARIWLRRYGGQVYLAAELPDTTFYWGDDLVLSLDTGGDRAAAPQHDDFQWYFRRVLDSSVVFRGRGGVWDPPRWDPDWRLGTERDGGGWEVRGASDARGWSLELRLDPAYFTQAPEGRQPGLGVRAYDDEPQGWYVWPARPELRHPTELEARPEWWGVVLPAP